MATPRPTYPVLAACLRRPELARDMSLETMPVGAERALLAGIRDGAVQLLEEGGELLAVVDAHQVPDADRVAGLAAWLASAPRALAEDGEALLATRARPRVPGPATIAPLGALALWRRELAEGRRTMATADPLWRAACAEAAALDAAREGDARGARAAMERAAAYLADAQRAAA